MSLHVPLLSFPSGIGSLITSLRQAAPAALDNPLVMSVPMNLAKCLMFALLASPLPISAIGWTGTAQAQEQEQPAHVLELEGYFKENPSTVGLTTGYSLVLDSGHEIQVDLLFNGLDGKFRSGLRARVVGPYKSRIVLGQRILFVEATNVEDMETSLSGTLYKGDLFGPGSSGELIFSDDGTIAELDLETNKFQKTFNPGDVALVNGYYKTVQRSKGPVRVLVVTAIAVN